MNENRKLRDNFVNKLMIGDCCKGNIQVEKSYKRKKKNIYTKIDYNSKIKIAKRLLVKFNIV